MIWDAERLNKIIHDPDNHDTAEKVLEDIISYSEEPCSCNKHFFRVEMIGVNKEDEKLLDVDNIKQYISEVAPVEFSSTFYFSSEIERFINEHDEVPPLNVYPIYLREEGGEIIEVRKDYKTKIYKVINQQKKKFDDITGVQTDIIRDEKGEPVAWIWYAISAFKGVINEVGNPMRNLRLRQFNILIGDRETLSGFFKEDRGNHYFMGEVHTLSKALRPNARRDYFNESQATKNFEDALREYITNNLEGLYRDGSKMNSAYNKLADLKKLENEMKDRQEKGAASKQEEKVYAKKKDEAIEKAKKAIKEINRIKTKATKNTDTALSKIIKQINKNNEDDGIQLDEFEDALSKGNDKGNPEEQTESPDFPKNQNNNDQSDNNQNNLGGQEKEEESTSKKKPRSKHLVDELSFLNKKERKLVSSIYGSIQKNMEINEANALIEKIQEDLKNRNVS